jgi:hypothetical protein
MAYAAMQMRFVHAALRLETRRRLMEDTLQIVGPTVMAMAYGMALSQQYPDVAMAMAFGAQAALDLNIDHLGCE